MSGLMIALPLISGLMGAECDALLLARRAANDRHEYESCLALINQEVECRRKALGAGLSSVEPGSLHMLCLSIDAGFHVASRGTYEPELAQDYLRLYEEVGCLVDPFQRPRHRTNLARHLRRTLEDQRALAVLRQGESEALLAWFRHRDKPELLRQSLVWSIANSMAARAEIAAEYLRKGSQVYVEGRLQTRKWQDRDGNERYTTEIVCNDMQMLGGRGGGGGGNYGGPGDRPASPGGGGGSRGAPAGHDEPPMGDFDDDIPF